MELIFARDRETKNTVRFEEVERPGQPKIIGALYVQKSYAGDAAFVKMSLELTSLAGEGEE